MKIEDLFDQKSLVDLSFFNFRNAATGAYFADSNLKIQRVNNRFKDFFPILKNVEDAYLPDVLSQLGVSNQIVDLFVNEIKQKGGVLIPEIPIDMSGEKKVFSLLSRVTKDDNFHYLNGIQGQFIDRTSEYILKAETERLLKQQRSDQKLIEDKSKELEILANKLSKYLSPQIYRSIFSEDSSAKLTTSRKNLTIFFSDIVKFTDLSDSLEPEQLSAIINSYLSEMSKIAIEYGGTIDKFIGDAILIFFGDPESKGSKIDAKNCILMAKEMQLKINEMQEHWKEYGAEKNLSVRIGITTGYCTVGNFGSEMRLDYTVLGSPVNLASRLQSKANPNSILVSEATYNLLKDEFIFKEFDEIIPKGFVRPIKIYEIFENQELTHNQLSKIFQKSGKYINVKLDKFDNIDEAVAEIENFKKELRSVKNNLIKK
tara:strand:- start:239 stop:1525 length:1287 start_codon:yes stop_codon:yes gene_type:complete